MKDQQEKGQKILQDLKANSGLSKYQRKEMSRRMVVPENPNARI